MQRIKKGVYLLEAAGWVNAYLIEGPRGLTLVDTGHGNAGDAIADEIEKGGFQLKDLEQVLITHSHFDHMGGAAILLDRKRVKVYAHPDDMPAIKGVFPKQGIGTRLGRWLRSLWFPYRPLDVIVPIKQGEHLRALPNWQVLHTPGHTPGSLSLFQPTEKILICGDALSMSSKKLALCSSYINEDHVEAARTARMLSNLDADVLCCGHGPVILSGGALKLQKLADAL
jgi:glyoxylase-like metal-dependent hydrolase (beta-lactamase superfamily II)